MLRQGYAGKMKREGIDQARKNEEVYNAQSAQHRMQIEKLTERIRNVLITHREDSTVRSLAGRIRAEKIWRALYLEDARVFTSFWMRPHPSCTGRKLWRRRDT